MSHIYWQVGPSDSMLLSRVGGQLESFEKSRQFLIHSTYVCTNLAPLRSPLHSPPFPLSIVCSTILFSYIDIRSSTGGCCLAVLLTGGWTTSLWKMCNHLHCATHRCSHSSLLLYPRLPFRSPLSPLPFPLFPRY